MVSDGSRDHCAVVTGLCRRRAVRSRLGGDRQQASITAPPADTTHQWFPDQRLSPDKANRTPSTHLVKNWIGA